MKAWIFSVVLVVFAALSAQADISTNRTYQDVARYIYGINLKYPQSTRLFTLGYSDAGIPIYGLQIGRGRVEHLLVAIHHGNEVPAAEVALNFADFMAAYPIPGQSIYIIPVLNIDGYNKRSRWEIVNGQQLDLNRDYPGPCGSAGPFMSRSTKALAKFIAQRNIVAAATLHTYKPAVVYPWGLAVENYSTPYDNVFHNLARAATIESGYPIGYSSEIMYPANGTFEDYAFWKHGIYSLLFEIGASNRPEPAVLMESVRANVIGLREFFKVSPTTRATDTSLKTSCSMARRFMDMHAE